MVASVELVYASGRLLLPFPVFSSWWSSLRLAQGFLFWC